MSTFGGDIFDIRDTIKRFEELESDKESLEGAELDQWADAEEFQQISDFLDEVKGYGGDEQWRGDWYPISFIADTYFEQYAQELAEDIGAINRDASWPNNCIDWERAASELQQDYSSVEIDGSTYWYR